MCSVITDIYKMKKRRSPNGDEAVASTASDDPNLFRPIAYCVSSPSSSQNQHKFTNYKPAPTSPRTPRRSPRISGAISRRSFTSDANQSCLESPESLEPLITWKCNSPVYAKSLQPMSGRDLHDIVQKFVPNTKTGRRQPSSSVLLDLWWAPCETPTLIPPTETKAVHPIPKPAGQAARELQELIEKVKSGHFSDSNDGLRNETSKRNDELWGDDDLFEDENVIATTQQIAQAPHWHFDAEVIEPTQETPTIQRKPEVGVFSARVKEKSIELGADRRLPDERCSPDILDCATQLVADAMLNCATQVDERSTSSDMMGMGFMEQEANVGKSVVPSKMESRPFRDLCSVHAAGVDVITASVSQKACPREEILRKREEALRRRGARLLSIQPKNILHAAAAATASSFKQIKGNETCGTSKNDLRKVVPVTEIAASKESFLPVSQAIPFSQPCTQDEIQRKKEEALKRRSARLAALAACKPPCISKDTQKQSASASLEEQRRLCTLQEIERKRREAIEKRQKRLMQQKSGNHVEDSRLPSPRLQRLVPFIN